MTPTFVRMPGRARPAIDITPGAGWRRAVRTAAVVLALAVALPVLWLLGTLTLLGLLGAAVALVSWALLRQWLGPKRRSPLGPAPGPELPRRARH